jgi:hypothetical protein
MDAHHNCYSDLSSTRYLFFGDEKYLDECMGGFRSSHYFVTTFGVFDGM